TAIGSRGIGRENAVSYGHRSVVVVKDSSALTRSSIVVEIATLHVRHGVAARRAVVVDGAAFSEGVVVIEERIGDCQRPMVADRTALPGAFFRNPERGAVERPLFDTPPPPQVGFAVRNMHVIEVEPHASGNSEPRHTVAAANELPGAADGRVDKD